MSRILVVGGGFAGLTTAWFLQKQSHQVHLVETQERFGGLIRSIQTDRGLVETAANGILRSPLVDELLSDIQLKSLLPNRSSQKRYIYRGGPRRWPLGVCESLQMAYGFVDRKKARPGESLQSWTRRRFGSAFSEYLAGPAIQGVYAASAGEISAEWIESRFASREKRREKKIGTLGFERGMGQLIEKMASCLSQQKNVTLEKGRGVESAEFSGYDRIVFATNRTQASELLKTLKPDWSHLLKGPMASLVSVTGFCESKLVDGFGCLLPPSVSSFAMGVLQNDQIFEARVKEAGIHSETWILRGPIKSPGESLKAERLRLFPGASELAIERETHWNQALPLYSPEWFSILRQNPFYNDKIALVGNYVSGIGLTDILKTAARVAKQWKS